MWSKTFWSFVTSISVSLPITWMWCTEDIKSYFSKHLGFLKATYWGSSSASFILLPPVTYSPLRWFHAPNAVQGDDIELHSSVEISCWFIMGNDPITGGNLIVTNRLTFHHRFALQVWPINLVFQVMQIDPSTYLSFCCFCGVSIYDYNMAFLS